MIALKWHNTKNSLLVNDNKQKDSEAQFYQAHLQIFGTLTKPSTPPKAISFCFHVNHSESNHIAWLNIPTISSICNVINNMNNI